MDEDKDKAPPITEPEAEPSASEDKTRLISLPEASEIYGFSQVHLAQLCQKGRLKAHKFGNSWATTPANIEEYIASRQKRGAYRADIQVTD